jgi:membrane protease YdiL (CAAX protease family)
MKTGRRQGSGVTGQRSLSSQQWTMVAVPPVLIVTMYVAFRWLTVQYGFPLGYLLAFGVYWSVWCLAVPVAVLGTRAVLRLFRDPQIHLAQLDMGLRFALWGPPLVPLLFVFRPRIASTPATVVAASVVLGVVIGITEELLWRGVYVALFADNVWLNTIYPSLAFGLWHLCPLSVAPSRHPGGGLAFVGYSFVLGLSYAYPARRTRSIAWSTLSHCVHDALGLGGLAYVTWLT